MIHTSEKEHSREGRMLREPPLILIETIQKLIRRDATPNLIKVIEKTHPADIAIMLRRLSEREGRIIFGLLDEPALAAETLSELNPENRFKLLEGMAVQRIVEILRAMSPDDMADTIGALPEEMAEQILEIFREDESEQVEELLQYGEDTAGGIMTPDFFALPDDTRVDAAVLALQQETKAEMVFYLYVIDERNHLVGVLSLRQLLTNAPDRLLRDIMMDDVLSVYTGMDQEEVARLVAKYNILAVPVVDDENKILGIVTVDDVIDVFREEATEDILKLAGTSEEEILSGSFLKSARTRFPWLFASWVGGLFAIGIIGHFEEELKRVVSLAAFIPIIMGMGGNVGNQSTVIMVRGMATGRIDLRNVGRHIMKEMSVGILLGIFFGVLLSLVVELKFDIPNLSYVVGCAISTNMIMAAFLGTSLPVLFKRMKIDPAVATGPFVTTSIDIIGIFILFIWAILFNLL